GGNGAKTGGEDACMPPGMLLRADINSFLVGPFPAGALDSLLLLADSPGAGGVGRDRLLANACYTTLASCGRAFTAPGDRAAAESARPWASCLCRPRRGPVFDCRTSTTGRGPSNRRSDRRCDHPSIWRSSPSGMGRAD